MDFSVFVFYFLAAVLVFAALRVVTLRHPVHAALHLVLAFFSASGLFVLLQAEFLAIALILIYVGAVMVLFLFVVMMLDINIDRLREGFWKFFPVGAMIAALMAFEMALVLWAVYGQAPMSEIPAMPKDFSNVQALGRLLFTEYAYPFELASVVLLVGIVAAVSLTLRGKRHNKAADPAAQVLVKAKDRVAIIKMKAEVDE